VNVGAHACRLRRRENRARPRAAAPGHEGLRREPRPRPRQGRPRLRGL